ncbi:MAG: radical SAM protein [Planctomycetota bacterium]
MAKPPNRSLDTAYREHGRHWRQNAYCYPVVSRRSGGLSIGINLNPEKACNFDCVYCQVDRTTPPEVRGVDLSILRTELNRLLDMAVDQSLFEASPFDRLGAADRIVRDIAFSGDGEPTAHPRLGEAVRIAADARRNHTLDNAKLVLLTNACYLAKPEVRAALRILDENNGEIWAKLDAGTQAYFERVNRSRFSLGHVIENILDAARVRPVVIQSLWMRIDGKPPPEEELRAFADRLEEIRAGGGQIKLVQLYTVARRPAETFVAALSREELERIGLLVRQSTGVTIETYAGFEGAS